jgi:hypothetical protein
MTNNRRTVSILGQSLLALTVGGAVAYAQVPASAPPPLSYPMWLQLRDNPGALRELLSRPAPIVSQEPVAGAVVTGPWQSLNNPLRGGNAENPLLLTDGTVIVHIDRTRFWWQLTPDTNGSYVNGTWSQIATLLPPGYAPRFFGSQVLSDGRVIINGGEYNDNDNGGMPVWTSMGAIYHPLFGAWRNVPPPMGWANIGDAQTVVLNDGTYMLANALTKQQALFNAANLTWTATGTGKADRNDEEGWTLLPSGDVLAVDAYTDFNPNCPADPTGSERYRDATGDWVSAGSTIVKLPDCGPPNRSYELGPQVLRPDGTVIAFGGTTSGVAHTAIFDSSTGIWSVGPDIPSIGGTPYTLADAPAALLPSGNILFAASPSNWQTNGRFPNPTHFFEVSLTNSVAQVTDNPDGARLNSFQWNFLLLPTRQVLAAESDTPNVWIYTPSGSPDPAWAPVISTWPPIVRRAFTYQLTGTQFNGLSEGVAYGDDVQASTNYPIVKIVNNATGHVFYERTSGFSTRSVNPGTATSTNFMISGKTETGASSLYVIANGISSTPVPLVVQ